MAHETLTAEPAASWGGGRLVRALPKPALRRLRTAHRQARAVRQLLANLLYDARRYLRWSAPAAGEPDRVQSAAMLTLNAHRIEKGLALPDPRPGFGADALRRLATLLDDHTRRFGGGPAVDAALDALAEYRRFTAVHGLPTALADDALERFGRWRTVAPEPAGGTVAVERGAVLAALPADPEAFFGRRHSLRQFDPRPVDLGTLDRAVRLAQRAPSVCNRQAARVHAFTDPLQRRTVLGFQNGNRGFGDSAGLILAVTVDLRHFTGAGERHQGWIDGGLFAMSLVYAFHAVGLGACMLNWSVTADTDRRMRLAAGIPDWEAVVMLVAVGHLPERFRVALSARKPLADILSLH